jgi:hypothetical protein
MILDTPGFHRRGFGSIDGSGIGVGFHNSGVALFRSPANTHVIYSH